MTGFVYRVLQPVLRNVTPCKFLRHLTAVLNPEAEVSRLLPELGT
jgi:hypothetical protein